MSSIITRAGVVLAGALLLISAGCSKARTSGSGVLINPDTGKHAPQWATPAMHGAAAKGAASSTSGLKICQDCHSTDFSGGISKITCLNMMGCHGAGVMAPHAHKPWRAGMMTHTDTDPSNAPVCAQCHMNGGNSSVHPSPFDPMAAPGCFNNTLCHAAAVGHPPGWALPTAHGAAAKSAPSSVGGFKLCQDCHGNDFTGGNALTTCLNTAGCHGVGVNAPHPAASAWLPGSTYIHTSTNVLNAPVCALCHTDGLNSSLTPSPPATVGTPPGCFNNTLCHAAPACGTCHGIPPNGTVSPNVAGQHAPHIAVSTSISCATCHNGAGFGTALHINGVVDVILDTTYNAKSGTAVYTPARVTCSNISCHGGSRTQSVTQARQNPPQSTVTQTPSWLTGATDCTACHVLGSALGTPENNSYYSGRHYLHLFDPNNGPQPKLSCTACHDTSTLAVNHFTTLNTTAMEGPASATILNSVNYSGGSCTPACHGNETW